MSWAPVHGNFFDLDTGEQIHNVCDFNERTGQYTAIVDGDAVEGASRFVWIGEGKTLDTETKLVELV